MASPASELERALMRFRREQASGYLRRLAGEPSDVRVDGLARRLLASDRVVPLFEAARESGELSPELEAASAAHVGRAVLEYHYASARELFSSLLSREVSVEGDTRAIGSLLDVWAGSTTPAQRERTVRAMEPELVSVFQQLIARRADADAGVSGTLAELAAGRHPDAGPEGGARKEARAYLDASAELAFEAVRFTRTSLGHGGNGGLDHLWMALGQEFRALFPRAGRLRRIAADWEPLGLRQLLSARARAAHEHLGPLLAPQLLLLAPTDVRLAEAPREYGLASEIATVEAVGRAVGYVHASDALPFALRLASGGSVARALGALGVQRLFSPHFLRRVRGFGRRESETVARIAESCWLLDARLAAAAVLARTLHGPSALTEAAALAEEALLGPVSEAAALLVLRTSPGAPFRGKAYGPALAWALRERFDEDWYLNPRAGEPLRGAAARAGTLAVESFATELGCEVEHGLRKLAELF
jgi:hypothetical protein